MTDFLRRFRFRTFGGGEIAILACALAAYLSLLLSPQPKNLASWQWLILIAGGIFYLVFGVFVSRYCEDHRSTLLMVGYFAFQLALCLLLLIVSSFSSGMWVLLMPVAGYGTVMLPRRGLVILCAAIVLIMVGSVLAVGGSLLGAVQAGVSFFAGLIFVVIFTKMTANAIESKAEVERLAAELEQANHKLREYAAQAEELATTKERNRLAREIHDSLGHYLTVVNMQLEAAKVVIETDKGRTLEALNKAQSLTKEGLGEVRRSVAALRASPVETRSLVEAIAGLVQESCNAGIITELKLEGEANRLNSQTELTLYRAAQEGLTNVRKHSGASRVDVCLDFSDSTKVRLVISDNGQGTGQTESGFGLLGLRERVQLLNGVTAIETAPGQGFRLEVELPR